MQGSKHGKPLLEGQGALAGDVTRQPAKIRRRLSVPGNLLEGQREQVDPTATSAENLPGMPNDVSAYGARDSIGAACVLSAAGAN